ncbi:hypothetical protein [Cyclonatronum proteinivorum]|uniref:hypothetical protein n=1 Tax=Cyclonatronum proteinivorum TaxID=1457365 RepID=UPI0013DE7BB6|nr:hypothetical protein [Cyclonatronum proteinivorum]
MGEKLGFREILQREMQAKKMRSGKSSLTAIHTICSDKLIYCRLFENECPKAVQQPGVHAQKQQ